MNHLDNADGAIRSDGPPATLLPLVYDPDNGRLFWLGADRRVMTSAVDHDGYTQLTAAASVPAITTDDRLDAVRALLDDIATYTGRPLRLPIGEAEPGGHEQYAVVWVDNSLYATTPRQAAEQAWRTIRRPGSHACVFQVVNRRTGHRIEVDLLDDVPDEEATTGGAGKQP
jgi:hypothetical protein